MSLMRRYSLLFLFAVLAFCLPASASSTTAMADWCFNNNGDINTACNGAGAGFTAGSTFDATLEPGTNNLGSTSFLLAAGQYADAYMDYDLDFASFGSFQDYGSTNGTLPAGVSWEMDDPNVSNIFSDFAANALNGVNNVGTPGGPPSVCCDVSWALGVKNETAAAELVTFTVSATAPTSGFYLQQTNFDVGNSIYLSETVTPEGTTSPVPEGSTLNLVLSGVGAFAFVALGRRKSTEAVCLLP